MAEVDAKKLELRRADREQREAAQVCNPKPIPGADPNPKLSLVGVSLVMSDKLAHSRCSSRCHTRAGYTVHDPCTYVYCLAGSIRRGSPFRSIRAIVQYLVVFSWAVLRDLVLSCPFLSCPVLSYPILSCVVWVGALVGYGRSSAAAAAAAAVAETAA